jgi:hypothetical protein
MQRTRGGHRHESSRLRRTSVFEAQEPERHGVISGAA